MDRYGTLKKTYCKVKLISGELPSSIFGVSISLWAGPYGYMMSWAFAVRTEMEWRCLNIWSQSLKPLLANIYVHVTSCLYKEAKEMKQEDWTAQPDHTTKKDKQWLIMVTTLHQVLSSLLSEMQVDMSHSTIPYKQGCQTKQEGVGKLEPT